MSEQEEREVQKMTMIPSTTLSDTAQYYRNEAGRTYHAKGGASYVYPFVLTFCY
ncbi:hypothetical protein BT69DRAFT_1291489 [Atractiella rhizophila]|nr:hypothetical protein BT69DRAFT_1291489 [Atractiella rhizophila]